ncbi:hypothetical protein Q4E93_32540 [Flavitalea sp. BT771]|uniref:hypothetical protein n=1 Tax=Flavitalea sp. BT771 TaxID=3063329 RepID=UPI0026E3290A|nr:hypothetical protein [Flavitalea sp. BT771]MDO6435390.1 hypothetical protein [Flavitalea sp. BT771]MDV6224250.1 hypothetical protein [Flavitalea sp. BT771]
MKPPRKWLDDDFIRNLLPLIGMRVPFDLHKDDDLIPYFQYKVGPYQKDYYLYFKQPPNKFQYNAEIFGKMYEYRGYDLVRYIEFHYKAYENKDEFVRFLYFEVLRQQRMIRNHRWMFWVWFPRWKASLETTMRWVEEEKKRLQSPVPPAPEIPQEALAMGKEGLIDKIEEEISTLLRTYLGRIDLLYNEHDLTKVVQVLILLQNLKEPGQKGLLLFKNFSDMDMASLLRQFVQFGDYKTNTLQVKISGIKKEMKMDDPALEKLYKALQEFFFP